MSRYGESLDDWAELHGEITDRPTGPITEHCRRHGEHIPESTGDCGKCLDEYHARPRDLIGHVWQVDPDALDAHHDHHTSQEHHTQQETNDAP